MPSPFPGMDPVSLAEILTESIVEIGALIPPSCSAEQPAEQEEPCPTPFPAAARLANEKDGLHKAMRQFAEKTSQGELVFIGNADNGVALDQVRELLGKEDGSEQGTGNDSGVTFYDFSWVRVGFARGGYPFVLRCS